VPEPTEARNREQAVRLLQLIGRHDLAHDPVERRVVERDACAAEPLQDDQLPDLRVMGHEQQAHSEADDEARGVARDHDDAPRQAVAEHAAEREHRDLRERPGCEAQPDLRCAAAEIEHSERHRDRCEVRPDVGDRAAREEEPEVAVAQRLHDRIVTGYTFSGKGQVCQRSGASQAFQRSWSRRPNGAPS
jgi:hypothetical protein